MHVHDSALGWTYSSAVPIYDGNIKLRDLKKVTLDWKLTAVHAHQVSFRLGSHCRMWDETIYDGFITQRPYWMKFSLKIHCHKRIEPTLRLGSHCHMWDETIYDGFITQRLLWMKFSLEINCHKSIEPALRLGSHCRMYDETIYDGFIEMQRERWINCSLELHRHKCIEAAFRIGPHYYKCIEVWLGWDYTVKMNRLYYFGREGSIEQMWAMHWR